MERFTISLDSHLASQFEKLVSARRYASRSEAIRDLIRFSLDRLAPALPQHCDGTTQFVATVSFHYCHRDTDLLRRLQALKCAEQAVVVSCGQTLFEHGTCVETLMLRGAMRCVQDAAERFLALRGIRHGNVSLAPLVRIESAQTISVL